LTDQERRASPRLDLTLSVEFLSEGQEQPSRMGTTRNVSAGGVYFTTPEWHGLSEGQTLQLRLSGLASYGTGPLFKDLRARAVIRRLEPPQDPSSAYARAGVAVSFVERPYFEVYNWSK